MGAVVSDTLRTCGHCGLPIHPAETGIRHYGHFESHAEIRCVRLLQAELAAAQARIAELERDAALIVTAADEFRDIVLNSRGALAENGMTNDQTNDVLGEFDDSIGAALQERAK